jgi:hypothetical protein
MESRFQVLRSRTRFWRYRGRRVPLSCFARPDTFLAVPSASGPVFMFCVSGLVFGAPEGDESRFHVLRALTRFRRYRGHRVSFLSFAFLDSFFAVPRASSLVFKFCASGLFFGGTEGISTRFHVLSYQTHFQQYRGRRLPFSCFACPDSFLMVPRPSDPVFIFCAPGLIFSDTASIRSRFQILRSRTRFLHNISSITFIFSHVILTRVRNGIRM